MRHPILATVTVVSLAVAVMPWARAQAPTPLAVGTEYYVSSTGSDANACTISAPCRQIRRALSLVSAGSTILVADGSYLGFDVDGLHGTAGAPITIKAQGAGAQVVPTTDRSDNRDTIFITSSSYIVVDGLRSVGANRAAVRVDQSPNVTVRNGVFGNNGTWGIFTDFADDLLLENNECYGSVAEHGIYVSNSGDRPVLRRNRVHGNNASGIQLNADLSAGGDGVITGAVIEANVIYDNGTAGGAAINLDGVQDSIVRSNVLYNNRATGIVNYQGDGGDGPRGMEILHNTIDMPTNGRWALLFANTTGSNVVRGNILYNRSTVRGGITYASTADAANSDSDYNILDRVTPDDGDTVLTLSQWQAQGHEIHSFFAADTSLWVNPATADYHLKAGSPAIDQAPPLADASRDLEAQPRPWGALADVGADEVVPPNFTTTVYLGGLSNPTAMQFAPDGRLFVCEQTGQLRVFKNGSLLPTPFVSLSVDSNGERGLLGVAFDPDFATNQFVYVYYTVASAPIHNRVSRFTASGDVATGGEVILLDLNNLSATNHNGGALHFGPDRRLYVAVGENANGANAQSMNNLLGKMLRINADGTIPADNPFFASASGVNRAIWALGLRNPFTFDFQPGSRRMFINDVGQDTFEEIDDGIAGSNYGWPTTEGATSNPSFRSPLYTYQHAAGNPTGCAITGGAFYNPATVQFPADYIGDYFFSDYCGGWIWKFDPASGTAIEFATGIANPVDLKVTSDGSLFYLARGEGRVYRVQNTPAGSAGALTCPAAPVAPSASYTVTVSGGISAKDWVAQYLPGSPNNPWIGQFKYVPLPRPQTVSLTAPDTAGPYEVRLLANDTFTAIGTCALQVAAAPALSINDVTVTEGNTGTVAATFTVTLSPTSSGPVTVNWATANGTATQPSDYLQGSGALTFNAGESTKTVTVQVNGDTTSEPNETFFVNLSGASGASISDAQGQGTITNDDAVPMLTCPTAPVPPGGTYTATVNGGSTPKDWVAQYAPGSPNSPWLGQFKYVPLPRPQMVSMTAPGTGGTYELREFANDGFTPIGSCTFQVASPPALSINDVTVTEGNTGTVNANFTVTLSPASTGTVTVNWATADGTATQPSDYTAASGSLSFAAGETSKTVTVAVKGDTTAEPNETFFVGLSAAVGATLSVAQGQGTITNDDGAAPTVTCPASPVPSGGTYSATVTAGASAKDWVAQYTPASPNSPWIGQFKYVPLPRPQTISMTAPAPAGTYELRLFANDTFTSIGSCTFQVAAVPALSINDVTVTEGSAGTANATFTVTLAPTSAGAVSVNWMTADGTATQPSDYAPGSGSLTFGPGESTKTISVAVKGDTVAELDETFFVNLSGAAGATLSDAQGQATITNDDGALPALACPTSPVPRGGSYTATVNAGTSAKDWLGQYTPGAANGAWIGPFQYVPLPRPRAVMLMAPSSAGPYDLRLFANDGFTLLGSCTFQVQ
jgi:parallel beta-helix repeat protein